MGERRKLALRKESLTELTGHELHEVIGGATMFTFCQCTSVLNCGNTYTCPSLPGCVNPTLATCP